MTTEQSASARKVMWYSQKLLNKQVSKYLIFVWLTVYHNLALSLQRHSFFLFHSFSNHQTWTRDDGESPCFIYHDRKCFKKCSKERIIPLQYVVRIFSSHCTHSTVGNKNDKLQLSSLRVWLIHRLASNITYHQSSDLISPQVCVCGAEAHKWNVGLITFYLMPRSRPCPLRN